MCFDLDSHPPIPPIAGAAVDGQLIHLHSADGTEFSAFHAIPAKPSGAAILVLPDVRGLYRFYEELALRFAEAGVEAIAIDYFGRTAGRVEQTPRDDDFEYMSHVEQLQWPRVVDDMRAATDVLHAQAGGRAVFATGFCMGGRFAFDAGMEAQLGMAGVIGFYGWPSTGSGRGGSPSPTDGAATFTCPVLGLFGGADQGIPQAVVEAFDAALGSAGIEHEMISYPGAPHSFFDRKAAEFSDASTDSWRRTLDFIADHTPNEGAAAA